VADTKISAGADPGTLTATDKLPLARSASTTAYAATMAEIASYANTAYTPNYSAAPPMMDGTAAPGVAAAVSRGDHIHPSDLTRAPLASPPLTGTPTAPTPTTGDSTTRIATTAFVQAQMVASGAGVSTWNTRAGAVTLQQADVAAVGALHDDGRNLVMNGCFNIAQRGSTAFSTSGYTLDRWRLDLALDTTTVQQIDNDDAHRTQIGDEAATKLMFVGVTGNAGAGAFTVVSQFIEDVRRLAGKAVTVSFWAYATAGTPKIGVAAQQIFGTGGSPSAPVAINGTPVTLSTTAARYSVTFTYPSIIGKTVGTNPDHYSRLALFFSSGATNNAFAGGIGVQTANFLLWGVQLEIGSVATPLDYGGTPQQQLAACQRFYQVYTNATLHSNGSGTFGGAISTYLFSVTLRGSPTITPYGATGTATGTINIPYVAPTGVSFSFTSPNSLGLYYIFNYAASADL